MKLGTVAIVAATAVVLTTGLRNDNRQHAAMPQGATTTTPSPATTQRAPCRYRAAGALPDRRCTPGAVNRAVTQRTIRTTICTPGWAASVRPDVSVTEPWKFRAMRAYGVSTMPGQAQQYEYDHLIPIELGGAPLDTRNLFPQPHEPAATGSYAKDKVENRLKAEVCAGTVTLAAARKAIRTDWRTAP